MENPEGLRGQKIPESFVSALRLQKNELYHRARDRSLKEFLNENGEQCLPGLKAELEKLPEDKLVSVLDLGCGEGVAVRDLQKEYPNWEIHGLDLLPKKERKRGSEVENVVQGEASHLPYKSNQFDLVYSKFAYSYFPDKIKAIVETLRVAKPGGVILMQVSPGDAYEIKKSALKKINITKELQAKGIKGILKEDIVMREDEDVISICKSEGDDERAKIPFKFLRTTDDPKFVEDHVHIDSFYERVPEKSQKPK